jgi:predicted amidophosphoribosyltransferase
MKCPKCQTDNYAWYRYCRDCCTELEFSEEAQSSATEPLPASQIKLVIDPEVFYSIWRMGNSLVSW